MARLYLFGFGRSVFSRLVYVAVWEALLAFVLPLPFAGGCLCLGMYDFLVVGREGRCCDFTGLLSVADMLAFPPIRGDSAHLTDRLHKKPPTEFGHKVKIWEKPLTIFP